MKVDKNSPLGEMLLKMAAEHDPKLRRAIRNDEVGDLNIIALGAPDDEIKDLLESLFMGEDKCKNCEEVKAATPTDADDASNLDALLDEPRNLVCDDDTPEAVAMPSRIVLLSNDIMQILNHLPHLIAPKKGRALYRAPRRDAGCHQRRNARCPCGYRNRSGSPSRIC